MNELEIIELHLLQKSLCNLAEKNFFMLLFVVSFEAPSS